MVSLGRYIPKHLPCLFNIVIPCHTTIPYPIAREASFLANQCCPCLQIPKCHPKCRWTHPWRLSCLLPSLLCQQIKHKPDDTHKVPKVDWLTIGDEKGLTSDLEWARLCNIEGIVRELVEPVVDNDVYEFDGVIGCIEGCFNLSGSGKWGDIWTKWTGFAGV